MSKIIVITGAGAGLGRSLAKQFAADGDHVVLLGRTAAKLEAAAAEIGERAFAVQCDVGSPDSVREAFGKIAERFPRIDVLINNAALFQATKIETASDEVILGAINTNLIGPMLCTRAAIPLMERGGHIINVSSESLSLPFRYLTPYMTSKAGLEQFSRCMHHELEGQGIRVSIVRAGQMLTEASMEGVDPQTALEMMQANADAGLRLMERPFTSLDSMYRIFRSLVDLPPDLHAVSVQLHARATA